MLLKPVFAAVIIFITLLSHATICGAISEEKIVSSAKEIVLFWENLLSDKLDIVIYNPELHYWYVNRLQLVNRSLNFHIQKSVSITTERQLAIRLSYNRSHNLLSPNANSEYKYGNGIQGFKTAEDALANTGSSDFEEAKYNYEEKISRNMALFYVLKKNTWILKSWNDNFEKYIGQHISDVNNAYLFNEALLVPVK